MSTTPLLGIPELEAAQAQPEIVVNRAIRLLEAMSPLQALSRVVTAPPGSPADGDRYLVPEGASGVWAGHAQEIAVNVGGTWYFIAARTGWECYVEDEATRVTYFGGSPNGWA